MDSAVTRIENDIRACRLKLDAWLVEAYSDMPGREFYGEMDASYPFWHEIETVVGHAFDQRLISKLSAEAVESLLFFISRSDDVGRIIAWLHTDTGSRFSGVGDLSHEDFVFLCHQSLAADDDFCDYQLVACFQKLGTLNEADRALLRQFFERKSDSYTRRLVVHAFASFRLDDTVPLAQELWATDDCEFAKLSCLYSLAPFPNAKELFRRYLAEYERAFPAAEEDYRGSHLARLREARCP